MGSPAAKKGLINEGANDDIQMKRSTQCIM